MRRRYPRTHSRLGCDLSEPEPVRSHAFITGTLQTVAASTFLPETSRLRRHAKLRGGRVRRDEDSVARQRLDPCPLAQRRHSRSQIASRLTTPRLSAPRLLAHGTSSGYLLSRPRWFGGHGRLHSDHALPQPCRHIKNSASSPRRVASGTAAVRLSLIRPSGPHYILSIGWSLLGGLRSVGSSPPLHPFLSGCPDRVDPGRSREERGSGQ